MRRKLRPHVDEAILISIDKLGADVRVRVGSDYSVERIGWQHVSLFVYCHTHAYRLDKLSMYVASEQGAHKCLFVL